MSNVENTDAENMACIHGPKIMEIREQLERNQQLGMHS